MGTLKSAIFIVLIALAAVSAHARELVVVGSDDSLPVAGATLLSNAGHILGITDNHGAAEQPIATAYPLTVRSLGYEVLTLTEPADTVVLRATEYALPEVSIIATERPVRRILWYAREYTTGSTGVDTMQLYSEYMFESFIVDRKTKGYHSSDSGLTTKAFRRYGRISGSGRTDSVFVPDEDDEITLLAWGGQFCKLPKGKTEESIAIRTGASADSLAGKYGTEKIFYKGGNRYTVITDFLSKHKDHSWSPSVFKLLGMTLDINQCNTSLCFKQNAEGIYDIYDMLYSSVNLDIMTRGKIFKWIFRSKEPLRINTNIELYPVKITAHTIDEYGELRKDKFPVEFQLPQTILPEIPAVTALKRRIAEY